MSFDLFKHEEEVVERCRALIETGGADDDVRASFAALLREYERLFKTTRRLVRLSDRNETALSAMAEKQRLAVEEITRKNKELEVLSNKLSKYLSPQVYESIFSGDQEVKLASQRKKLTIFFSDIADFAETTDKMESEDLTQLLNQYLSEMSKVALEYGATIDKYVGDSIMIFFGDPETRGVRQDALVCVRMAVAMQRRLHELGEIWRAAGFEAPLRCRMGIHTGYCTVGNFGSNDRMDYTIIGGPVNIASRLEHEAPVGSILISYETYAHVRDQVDCKEHGQIKVKGIAYPLGTYEVVDLIENVELGKRSLNADLPHLRLEFDPGRMSAEEQSQATQLLQEALARISVGNPADGAAPRHGAGPS
jgi:adenylate cyclase